MRLIMVRAVWLSWPTECMIAGVSPRPALVCTTHFRPCESGMPWSSSQLAGRRDTEILEFTSLALPPNSTDMPCQWKRHQIAFCLQKTQRSFESSLGCRRPISRRRLPPSPTENSNKIYQYSIPKNNLLKSWPRPLRGKGHIQGLTATRGLTVYPKIALGNRHSRGRLPARSFLGHASRRHRHGVVEDHAQRRVSWHLNGDDGSKQRHHHHHTRIQEKWQKAGGVTLR